MSNILIIMTVYYYNIKHNRFYFDSDEPVKELAIWVDGSQGMKDMLETMLRGPVFMGRDRVQHYTDIERELFFREYIQRVFGRGTEVKCVDKREDLPAYNYSQ